MKVTHCISRLSPEGGGPSRSVPALADAEARKGVEVDLLHLAEPAEAMTVPGFASAFPGSFPGGMAASREMKARLLNGGTADIFHGHGIWELPVHYMARAARRRGRPYLIAPRGMLEPWALRFSRPKKRLAAVLFQTRDLRCADCLHAVSPAEVASFRSHGLSNPVAVVPNGVDPRAFDGFNGATERLRELVPGLAGRPVALFLSRIHPKKGLPHLLRAWRELRGEFGDWLLLIAGPDQLGHRAELEHLAADLELNGSVAFVGPLYREDKRAALGAAELFVLPSFSEGFSVAVLEAMAARLPVLITSGCNFPEVAGAGAGVIVEPEPNAVKAALRAMMSATESERRQMGERGHRLVRNSYTWDTMADRMIEVYEWLLNGRPVPSCVVEG